jgi:hypothetical protein
MVMPNPPTSGAAARETFAFRQERKAERMAASQTSAGMPDLTYAIAYALRRIPLPNRRTLSEAESG